MERLASVNRQAVAEAWAARQEAGRVARDGAALLQKRLSQARNSATAAVEGLAFEAVRRCCVGIVEVQLDGCGVLRVLAGRCACACACGVCSHSGGVLRWRRGEARWVCRRGSGPICRRK